MEIGGKEMHILSFWQSADFRERFLLVLFLLIFLFGLFQITVLSFPKRFPTNTTWEIDRGTTVSEAASALKENGYIKSSLLFKIVTVAFSGPRGIIAGDYYFGRRAGTLEIAWRMSSGKYGLVPLRITIPEGLNKYETADLLKSRLSLFDEQYFIEKAQEGRLFPDTYFFLPNATARDVIHKLEDNFERQLAMIKNELSEFGHPLDEVLTMASIVEEEANREEDRKIVAGILWKRLDIKMPLQVDATFKYVNGKNTYTLTREDLVIESPYNTYNKIGLPPTPISNPGLDTILSTIRYSQSDYLYFLSDLSGNMYYAKDFDGHQINRENYLRK